MAVSRAMSGLIPLLVRRRFSIRCSLPEKLEPIEPTVVQDGPCKQNILGREDVHIESLHSLFIHKDDGGTVGSNSFRSSFFLTDNSVLGMHVVQSPDGKWTN